MKQIQVQRKGQWIWVDVVADGFLHHMVHNIVGVLCRIGRGEESVDWATKVLEAKDRKQAGMTFPPDGLYFVRVSYDPVFNLPDPPSVCCFW